MGEGDPGKIGINGVQEKDINLMIAKKVRIQITGKANCCDDDQDR